MTHALMTTSATGVDWAAELSGAKMLLASGLAPQGLKTPEAALFVILAGRDLGLSPTQALRSVNVIQGKVEVAADMQLALFKRSGGRAEWRILTDSEAVLVLTHPNGDKHIESFSMADAKRAGLGGQNWAKFPKAMLRSRCITAGMKSVGFDVLAGVYAPGEVGGPEEPLEHVQALPAGATATGTATVVPGEAPQLAAGKPEATSTVDAELVDTSTGELFGADALETVLAFPLPFGKSKGTELGQMETPKLQSAMDWASEKGQYAEFVAAAKIVLASRNEKIERVTSGESGGTGYPKDEELAEALTRDDSTGLLF